MIWTRFGHVYIDAFGHEMGHHGSPRAHTLGFPDVSEAHKKRYKIIKIQKYRKLEIRDKR